MARVTVEDCLANVKNRFELVIIASKRARQLMRGATEPKVAWENDKATVVALREIAMGYTDFNDTHHHHENLSEPSAQTTKPASDVHESDLAFDLADDTAETSETTDAAHDATTHETSTSGNTPDSE